MVDTVADGDCFAEVARVAGGSDLGVAVGAGGVAAGVVVGAGDYDVPKTRLPGAGGAPAIAANCGEVLIILAAAGLG